MATTLSTTASIDSSRRILTLINTFRVHPDSQRRLAEELAAVTESRMQFLPGFIGASVHRSFDGHRVVNYVQWQTHEHFLAMMEDPAALEHMERVKALAIAVNPVLYEIDYVGALPAH